MSLCVMVPVAIVFVTGCLTWLAAIVLAACWAWAAYDEWQNQAG